MRKSITNGILGRAVPIDWPQIVALLKSVDLPIDGLQEHQETTLVLRTGNKIVGCAALELYDSFALLRSVAVAKSCQGNNMGQDLTKACLDLARDRGVKQIYLLTETAGKFFPRFGFRPIGRGDVPAAIQESVEFTSACPASALVMVLSLEQEPVS